MILKGGPALLHGLEVCSVRSFAPAPSWALRPGTDPGAGFLVRGQARSDVNCLVLAAGALLKDSDGRGPAVSVPFGWPCRGTPVTSGGWRSNPRRTGSCSAEEDGNRTGGAGRITRGHRFTIPATVRRVVFPLPIVLILIAVSLDLATAPTLTGSVRPHSLLLPSFRPAARR
jgi:hypothetical protein